MRAESWPRYVLANSEARPSERLLLLAMASSCSPDGTLSVSLTWISQHTGLQERRCRECIARIIEDLGEMILLKPATGRKPAVYRLTRKPSGRRLFKE